MSIIPSALSGINLLFWLVLVTLEPLEYCLANDSNPEMKDQALKNLEKIYILNDRTEVYDLYNELKTSNNIDDSLLMVDNPEEDPNPGLV